MDVTIVNAYNVHHSYNIDTNQVFCIGGRVQATEIPWPLPTATLSVRPIGGNSLGQCGPDCLKFLWLTADHAAQTQYSFSLDYVDNNCLNEHIIDSQQAIDYRRVRGKNYHENRLCLLTCILEAINEHILGVTCVLWNSNLYYQWLAQTRQNWLLACPIYDLSSQLDSQASTSFLGS